MNAPLRLALCLTAFLTLPCTRIERVSAIAFEQFGPPTNHLGRSADWTRGTEDVLRHPSRVYWFDINGSQVAYYDGDAGIINELLALYSQVDLSEHPVVIRPGQPSAESLHGKMTPYAAEFSVPGGLSVSFLGSRENSDGLYSAKPRLTLYLNSALAEHLDELRIPANVTVREEWTSIDDALAHAADENSTWRLASIKALGVAGNSSVAVMEVLKRAASEDNKSLHEAGQKALTQLAAEKSPASQEMRAKVVKFVREHPNRVSVPTPTELLVILRNTDTTYEKGFTARGTRVEPAETGAGELFDWVVTMGDDRVVVQRQHVENANHPRRQGKSETTIYVGPERMGTIHGSRLWADGKLIDAKPYVTFEPVGPNYDLLIGRLLWPLGRGYTRRIDRITSVRQVSSGLLKVTAANDDGLMSRWELTVDPAAGYLVRQAKGYRGNDATPSFIVDGGGVITGGGVSVLHTSRWTEGYGNEPTSIAVTSVSDAKDEALIEETERRLQLLPGLGHQGPVDSP